MKIVFMGTPTFGREILKCLHQNGYDVVLAVCQPDKYVGRKHVLTSCEVKQYCIENNIEVFQPVKIREDYSRVLEVNPDLIVTCAYGQIIPKIILDKCKCINVHASLLPKLRGGAPIQHAIIDGYSTTGITIMEMSNKMDAGDIISQSSIDIDINDTYSSLHDKLITVATRLLLDTIGSVIDNSYVAIKQNENTKKLGEIYRRVIEEIKGFCPDLETELGYKPWSPEEVERVNAWIKIVLSGNDPKAAINVSVSTPETEKAVDEAKAENPTTIQAAPVEPEATDDLPF